MYMYAQFLSLKVFKVIETYQFIDRKQNQFNADIGESKWFDIFVVGVVKNRMDLSCMSGREFAH